jgi:hypothetical protein
MIRFILGLVMTMTAAGSDAAPLWAVLILAALGISLMYWASRDLDNPLQKPYN